MSIDSMNPVHTDINCAILVIALALQERVALVRCLLSYPESRGISQVKDLYLGSGHMAVLR